MFTLLLACTPPTVTIGDGTTIRTSAPGTTVTEDDSPQIVVPQWNAMVLGVTFGPWTQTGFAIKLATDDEGNLLVDQPTGEYQPQVSLLITTERLTDVTHNGWMSEAFGEVEYVTVSVVDLPNIWIYDSSQIRSGLQVMQLNPVGEVIGYMWPVEGNSEVSVTFERCDGCDPP